MYLQKRLMPIHMLQIKFYNAKITINKELIFKKYHAVI